MIAAREYARVSQLFGQLDEAILTDVGGCLLRGVACSLCLSVGDLLCQCLKSAITCAILAPAGPDRTRLLASLYADERAAQVSDTCLGSMVLTDAFDDRDCSVCSWRTTACSRKRSRIASSVALRRRSSRSC